MNICQNNGCNTDISVPSIDCPGQCLPCAIESRERVHIAMNNSLQDQLSEWNDLEERATHHDTMRTLSPLESQWLNDYRIHFIHTE